MGMSSFFCTQLNSCNYFFLSNMNISISYLSFVCTQSNGSEYYYVSQTIQLNTHLHNNWIVKKFHLEFRKLNDWARFCRPKIVDSEAMRQIQWETLKESGKLGISQSSVVHRLQEFGKSIQSCQIVLHVTKILQNLRYHLY